MYYEETIINGVIYSRTTPTGQWEVRGFAQNRSAT